MANVMDLPITPTLGGVVTATAAIGAVAVLVGWILYATAPPLKVEIYKPGEGKNTMLNSAVRKQIGKRR